MDCLILVDLENDFMPGGALAVPRGDEVVTVANQLAARFDFVVASQDWHPAGARASPRSTKGACVARVQLLPWQVRTLRDRQHLPRRGG